MLARHIGSVPHNVSPEEFEKVAELTEEWSGSKLKDLAQEVTMRPVLECIEKADEVRRLAKMLERTGSLGDDSGQDGPRLSPDEAAHAELIENLQTLRAVTYDDFFWN